MSENAIIKVVPVLDIGQFQSQIDQLIAQTGKVKVPPRPEDVKPAQAWGHAMAGNVGHLAALVVKFKLVYSAMNLVNAGMRDMLRLHIETGYRMAQFRRNLQGTAEDLLKVNQAMREQARKYGQDILETMDVGIEWAKQGKNAQEVIDLTNATLAMATSSYMKTAEAQEFLTATMKAFKMESSEAMVVVDAVDNVSKKYAVNAQELAGALQRSAFAAQQVGLTFNQLIGIVGTVGDVTRQSGEHVGIAAKAMFVKMQSPKALGELQEAGIPLFDQAGKMKPMLQVLGELASKWQTLSDKRRSDIMLAVAGVHRSNEFLAIMSNFPQVIQTVTDSMNSEGEAMKDVNLNMDSLKKSIDQLKASWQSLWTDSNTKSALSGTVSALATTLDYLSKIDGLATKIGMGAIAGAGVGAIAGPVGAGVGAIAGGIAGMVAGEIGGKKEEITDIQNQTQATTSFIQALQTEREASTKSTAALKEKVAVLQDSVKVYAAYKTQYEKTVALEGEQSLNAKQLKKDMEGISSALNVGNYQQLVDLLQKVTAEYEKANIAAKAQMQSDLSRNEIELAGKQAVLASLQKQISDARKEVTIAYKALQDARAHPGFGVGAGLEDTLNEKMAAYQFLIDQQKDYANSATQLTDSIKKLKDAMNEGKDTTAESASVAEEYWKIVREADSALEGVNVALKNKMISPLEAAAKKADIASKAVKDLNEFWSQLKSQKAIELVVNVIKQEVGFWSNILPTTPKGDPTQTKADLEKLDKPKKTGGGGAKKEYFDQAWIDKQRARLVAEIKAAKQIMDAEGLSQAEIDKEIARRVKSYSEALIKASETMPMRKGDDKEALKKTELAKTVEGLILSDSFKKEYQTSFVEFMLDTNKDIVKMDQDKNDKILENQKQLQDSLKRLYMSEEDYLADRNKNILEEEKKIAEERKQIIQKLKALGVDVKDTDTAEKVAKAYEDYTAKPISVVAENVSDITNIAIEAEGLTEADVQLQDEQSRIMDEVHDKESEKLALDDIELENDQKGITNRKQLLEIADKHLEIRKQIAEESEKEITRQLSVLKKSDLKIEVIPQPDIIDQMPTTILPPKQPKELLVEGKEDVEEKIEERKKAIEELKKLDERDLANQQEKSQNYLEIKTKEIQAIEDAIAAYKQAKEEFRSAVFEPLKNWLLDFTQSSRQMSGNIGTNLSQMGLTRGFEALGVLEDKYLGGGITGNMGMAFMDPMQAAILTGHTKGADYAKMAIFDAFVAGAGVLKGDIAGSGGGLIGDISGGGGFTDKLKSFFGSTTGKGAMMAGSGLLPVLFGAMGSGKMGAMQGLVGGMPQIGGGIAQMIPQMVAQFGQMAPVIGQGVGMAVAFGLRSLGEAGMLGGVETKRKKTGDRTFDQMSSKIDVSNRELGIVNRNLMAIKDTLDPYARPDSYFFRSRVGMGVQNQQLTIKLVDGQGNSRGEAIVDIVARDFQISSVRGAQ